MCENSSRTAGASSVRQGLANLYRPNNRTLLLTLSLGLGTFLLLNLYLSREVLLAQFQSVGTKDQPNIFLFDIQPDQKTDVAEIVRAAGHAGHPGSADRDDAPRRKSKDARRRTFSRIRSAKFRNGSCSGNIAAPIASNCPTTEKIVGRPMDWSRRLQPGDVRPDFARRARSRKISTRRSATSWSSMSRASRSRRPSPACARSIGSGFRRTFLSSSRLGCSKTRPRSTCS